MCRNVLSILSYLFFYERAAKLITLSIWKNQPENRPTKSNARCPRRDVAPLVFFRSWKIRHRRRSILEIAGKPIKSTAERNAGERLAAISTRNSLLQVYSPRHVKMLPQWIYYLWPPYVIGQTIIFSSCGFYLLSSSICFCSPNLSGRSLDVYHTLARGVVLV